MYRSLYTLGMKPLINPRESLSRFSKDEALILWEKLLTLRKFEEVLAEYYPRKLMKTPTHLGIGQEAISVGVLSAKIEGDTVYSHHRSHNPYLASGGDIMKLVLELHGYRNGCSGGKGGSVHLTDRRNGFVASSAILGQAISLATGSALGHKLNASSNVSFCFFGDAALEEGVAWESFNFASLNDLPVVFVCENNGLSTESHLFNRKKEGTSFVGRVSSFGIMSDVFYGQDLLDIVTISKRFVNHVRVNQQPVFLEFNTYRFLEHVGPNFDWQSEKGFRSYQEQKKDLIHDPVRIYRATLVEAFDIESEIVNRLESTVESNIVEIFNQSRVVGQIPNYEDLIEDVI
jgi:TPP-dependent pyruvate/acetoin dehydrogenase alpha subunit